MRSVIACLAAMAATAAAQGINPASDCSTATALAYEYTLGTACYKGEVDHQTTGGSANTVTITIKFPAPSPTTAIGSGSPTIYGVAVFDSNQGALEGTGTSTETEWSFGTAPQVTEVATGTVTDLNSFTLRKRATSGFDATTRAYLYTEEIVSPSGEHTITFTTTSTSADKLAYTVMVKELTDAERMSQPIDYTFGSAATVGYKFVTGSAVRGRVTAGYSPGTDGRLVTDLVTAVTMPTGMSVTSAVMAPTTGGSDTANYRADPTSTGLVLATYHFPYAVNPRTSSSSSKSADQGWFTATYNVGFTRNDGTNNLGLDVSIAPGPFVTVTFGDTAETFTEATTLSSSAPVKVTFDASAISSSDNRATKTYELLKVTTPDRWWAMRVSGAVTDRSGTSSGRIAALSSIQVGARSQGQSVSTASAISSGLVADAENQGSLVLVNTNGARFDTSLTNYYKYPLAGVANPWLLTASSTSSSRTSYTNPNFPYYDTRISSAFPTYIMVCQQAGCGRTSSTTEPLRVDADLAISRVETIPGECSSNVDCAPDTGAHPSEERARHFSANGDPSRYSDCLLFVGADAKPETRCVECFSDCDCNPGQYCHLPTGYFPDGDGGVITDELSRLRAGSCIRKDINNTKFGRKCRSPTYGVSPTSSQSTSASAVATSAGAVPYVEDQLGPVACSDGIYLNASYIATSAGRTNWTGQRFITTWAGYCDGEGICRECLASVAGSSIYRQCSNTQVCLDGSWHRAISVDGTMRTLGNDTRASLLLSIVIFLLFVLFMAAWSCCCNFCCKRGAKKDTVSPAEAKTAGAVP